VARRPFFGHKVIVLRFSASSHPIGENKVSMSNVTSGELDQFIMRLGKLTFAMGLLEMTLIAIHCRMTGKSEEELGLEHAFQHRQALEKKVKSLRWTAGEEADFIRRLEDVRALSKRRNPFIHIAAGIVSDNSIPKIPAGSVIDLRSYGLGFTRWDGKSGMIGYVARKIDLDEMDKLVDDIHNARIGFTPYMDLVDKIEQPPLRVPEPAEGKLIARF
jgi:hypothetical protein